MPTVAADGATVHYTATPQTAGDQRPALVLVAGTGLDAQLNFGHLLDAFTASHTVYLPDYAGSGLTVEPQGPLTVELLAGQIAAVAEEAARQCGGEPVDLLGYSLGAVVAAAVAALHPHLVHRLVLVAGWPGPHDARQQLSFEVWRRLERTDHDLFTRFLQLSCFSAPFLSAIGEEGLAQLIANAPPITEGMRRHIDLDGRADLRDLLPKITAQTLVIGLTRDQVVPVEQARLVHEAIAGSRFTEIDSGHLVVFERPQELVAEVQAFLNAS
ncbi:MAG TPA: alpha/beta hydrolase [Actinocrinis sp.]|uniref:alpha/beta fold hydrolase n=1 Tax=Actinocrinis sp. TaxID=1920516 RepID=UPI002D3474AD|nr:alpha/beta hydrolase [Actinocrinis sp.]HZU56987.1 alpha/beta hydrolase [Actinocrinis sp.]